MSGSSGSGEACDLLQQGSPTYKGSEIIVMTTDTMATAASNQAAGTRSLEALFRVTDSELQTLSNRSQHKVKVVPRVASTVTRPVTIETSPGGTPTLVQYHVHEPLVPEAETSGKRTTPKKSKYACPYCGRVCAKPSVLQKHVRSHTNERPFPCQQCGFRFKTRSNLYKHQRSTSHQQRLPGSTETASMSVESSVEESFDSIPEPELEEEGNEEDQIIQDVEMVPSMVPSVGILGVSSAPLTLVDNDGAQIRTQIRDDDSVGVTVEYTRSDSLMRSSSLDRQTITTEMFSNRVDELISHNSKLLDKNIAPLQRRRLSRQNSDGRVESPRIILPSLVPTGMPPGTPGSVRSLSRQNSSLDTPLEDSVFHLPIATPTGMSPVIRFGNLATGNMQIIPIGRSQPGTPILLSPNQNILKVATPTAVAPGNVPILISPTQQAAPVAIATEGKASLKEKLKGHLLSRRLQRLQRESSTEGRSVSDPDPPAKRRLSRQVSMDTDDVIMTSMQSQESHDDVFVDLRDSVEVIVVNDDTPTPETLQIIQAPLAESVQILRTEDPLIDDVIILRDTTRPLLLLPTNQSLQIFIPGEPSLATNELGAWQNVNVVQSEPSTPVVISMIDETPDVDVQQLLLGHKYPSLRISTVTSFCTVLNLQPVYAPQSQGNQVSMYSKWRTARFNQNPLGLGTREFMSLYRSTHTSRQYSVAAIDSSLKITQSTVVQEYRLPRVSALVAPSVVKQTNNKFVKSASIDDPISSRKASKHGELRRTLSEVPAKPKGVEIFPGCIRSDEMYQYVRGRGRGRYVCQQCGIRCRKPSLLKKHFRAHTDLRPYICHACRFSFKTKGNLTKHMKSRYHSRKCHELGLLPVPTQVDDTQIDTMMLQLQMARGTSQDDDGDEDGDEVEEEEDEEIDVEGEVAVAGLERDMDHMDHMEDSELQIATDEIAAVSTVARASRRRSLPSSADVAMGTMRTPLLGDIMMGTDSRLSTVYGLSCDLLANEATLSEASLSPRSSPVAQSESVSQCSQNEAARSLLDLASRKDSPTSPIGQKRVEPNKTDSLIGQHPESIIRQESAPAGLIQPSQDGGQSHKTQIPTRLGTMYSSPPSPQHTKPRSDRDIPRAGFVPPLMQLGDKPAFSKALSLDLSKVNTYCAKRKNPKIVEVSPGGDERTLLTSSPSPEIQSRLTPEPVRLFVSSSQASESVPTAVKPTAIVAVSVPYVSTSPLVGHVRTVSVQSMSCLQSRSVTTVKASTATVPIARTLPQISGKSAIPRDSAQLLKSTQSVRELIRRLSSADSLDEPAETTSKRPAAVTRSDSLAKRPRLAEILSEDSSSRDSPRSSVELELSTRQRPANLVVQQPMAQMASPLASPMMMPYVVLQGQSTLQGQGSPLVLAQMPNLGMLGQSLLMQQPYLASSPMVTGAPATPPVMILSPSLVMDQSGQLTLSGGPQNFVFSPSPLVQPSSMFSTSALPIASPSPPMEHIIMETHTHVTMETHVARETASSPPVAMETCSTLSTSGSSSSSSSSTSVSESLPIEMTPMPGRVTTEVRNDDGRYKCQHCDKSFTHQHQLTLHKNIHAFERNYQCTECSLSFRSEYLLQKHKRSQIHHQKLTDAQMYGQASEENPRPFSCAECGVAFRIRGHLAKHMRSKQHLLRSDSELEEQGQSLQDEARSMSMGDDDVMGDVTPSVPSSRLDVGARRRRFASESDSFRRHVSDEDFDEVAIATTSTMTSVLSRALSTVAKSAVAIVSRSLSLDTSKRVAMNSETSSAAACRVNFSSRVTMTTSVAKPTQATIATSHGSRHEVLVYQCALCSRQFSSLTELEDHPCTGVAVVRNHVCDTCDAGFTSKSALDNHRLMHQPEQGLPFVCGICGQKFSQLGHLNTHVNSRHTGPSNRPWQRSPESVA